MTGQRGERRLVRELPDGPVVPFVGTEPFTFAPDSVGSLSTCMICRHPAGVVPVTVVGAAAVEIGRCSCGWIVSDSYLVHDGHLPMPPGQLQQRIGRALNCEILHYRY